MLWGLAYRGLLGLGGYIVIFRLWVLGWGATPTDPFEPVLGDPVVADASLVTRRARDIPVPPDAIWPWLIQIGTAYPRRLLQLRRPRSPL